MKNHVHHAIILIQTKKSDNEYLSNECKHL